MVEGGRIDHAHHEGNAYRALIDTQEFDQAIGTAAQMVDLRETLIIVSADHSHVFNIAGYPLRPLDELPYRVRSHVPGFANTAEHGHGILDLAYDINQSTGHATCGMPSGFRGGRAYSRSVSMPTSSRTSCRPEKCGPSVEFGRDGTPRPTSGTAGLKSGGPLTRRYRLHSPWQAAQGSLRFPSTGSRLASIRKCFGRQHPGFRNMASCSLPTGWSVTDGRHEAGRLRLSRRPHDVRSSQPEMLAALPK